MRGARRSVFSADGTSIGLVIAGSGPDLLLVHGGMASAARWRPLWGLLEPRCRVIAMDRRGRATSPDGGGYTLGREYDDVAAVAGLLAAESGAAVDVRGHSYGAVRALGAAARSARFRRIVLYEPPGPETVPPAWAARAKADVAAGRYGPALASFLTEIIGLTQPGGHGASAQPTRTRLATDRGRYADPRGGCPVDSRPRESRRRCLPTGPPDARRDEPAVGALQHPGTRTVLLSAPRLSSWPDMATRRWTPHRSWSRRISSVF